MSASTSPDTALLLLVVVLCCWGLWPTLRGACGAPVASFAALNIASQAASAFTCRAILGGPSASVADVFTALFDGHSRAWAVLLGGFMLAHGDHIGSLAMQFIPAGVAYPLYAGVSLLGGTLFNAIQVKRLSDEETPLFVGGLICIIGGLFCLAKTQDLDKTEAADKELWSPGQKSLLNDGEESLLELVSEGEADPAKPALSARRTVLLCLGAGLCSSGWSPLSTYSKSGCPQNWTTSLSERGTAGHKQGALLLPESCLMLDPFLLLCVFNVGQLCAWPSIAGMGCLLSGTTLSESFASASSVRAVCWGVVCGTTVATGYLLFFTASNSISPMVAFCFAACNPLLSIAVDCVRCKFNQISRVALMYLGGAVVLYSAAIAMLSQLK